jgi:hypothetical protein
MSEGAGLQGSADVLLPLSQAAHSTLLSLIAAGGPNTALRVSPFCHEGGAYLNEVRGWALDLPKGASVVGLPLGYSLFDGVSLVECQCSEAEVLRLLTHPKETRAALGRAIHAVMSRVEETRRASWARCRPTENGVPVSLYSAFRARDHRVSLCSTPDAVPLIDSEPWVPELSPDGFLGLYHHWHPTRKRLCLYMACQSYLPRACLELADLVRELPPTCTAHDVLHSDEIQWLRQACARNRARLIASACTAMGLPFPAMRDYHSASPGERMAVVQTETLHQDLLPTEDGGVRVLNYCAQHGADGTLCCMAPVEGLWLFHPNPKKRGLMPTQTPELADSAPRSRFTFTGAAATSPVLCLWDHMRAPSQPLLVLLGLNSKQQQPDHHAITQSVESAATDPEILAAYRRSVRQLRATTSTPTPTSTNGRRHLLFDEPVLQAMANKGWDRAHTQLVPFACGQFHAWAMHRQLQQAAEAGEAAHAGDLASAGLL